MVLMILGSLPFTLYVATLRGNRKALIRDQQVRGLARLAAGDLAGTRHLVLAGPPTCTGWMPCATWRSTSPRS